MSFSIVVHNNAGVDGILEAFAPGRPDVVDKAAVPSGTAYCFLITLAEVQLEMKFNQGSTGRYDVKQHAFVALSVVHQHGKFSFKPLPKE